MADSSSTPRFSEQETALILKRAAELQEGADGRGTQLSLNEIREIASEVGIGPSYVTEAVAELRHPPPRVGWLGAPTRFYDERTVPGALSTAALGVLVECVREDVGLHGQVQQVLDSIEWRAQSPLGTTIVTLAPRDGGTRVAVTTMRADQAVLVALSSFGIGAATTGVGLWVGLSTIWDPLSVSALASAGGIAATLWSARLLWRGVAQRWRRRTRAIVEAVAERATQLAGRDPRESEPGAQTPETHAHGGKVERKA
jgi:hypothetical protein